MSAWWEFFTWKRSIYFEFLSVLTFSPLRRLLISLILIHLICIWTSFWQSNSIAAKLWEFNIWPSWYGISCEKTTQICWNLDLEIFYFLDLTIGDSLRNFLFWLLYVWYHKYHETFGSWRIINHKIFPPHLLFVSQNSIVIKVSDNVCILAIILI